MRLSVAEQCLPWTEGKPAERRLGHCEKSIIVRAVQIQGDLPASELVPVELADADRIECCLKLSFQECTASRCAAVPKPLAPRA